MTTFIPRPSTPFSVAQLLSIPSPPKRQVLCHYVEGENFISPQSRSFNIVLSRDVRANSAIANLIGVHLANKYPEKRVLVVNTYAGPVLMKRTVRSAVRRICFGAEMKNMSQVNLVESQNLVKKVEGKLPNLSFLDVAYGTWDSWQVRRIVMERKIDIVLVNSFEFASMSRAQRERMATQLVQLQKETGLTIILFSHEMKKDIKAMMPARGAIGVISAHAATVWRIEEPDYNQLGLMDDGEREVEEELRDERSEELRDAPSMERDEEPTMARNEEPSEERSVESEEPGIDGEEVGKSSERTEIEDVHENETRVGRVGRVDIVDGVDLLAASLETGLAAHWSK